jgi:transcriptional regulator with XRE-family HTH domain
MNGANKAWELAGYGDIVGVTRRGNSICVEFANQDVVDIAISALGLSKDTEFRVDEETGALLANTTQGEREIDWMVLRSASDPEFADEVRERDAEEARRVGNRLRVLRENSEISQKAAAEMANMAPSQLAKLERGETDMRLSTVRSLLRVLGASLGDLAGPEVPEVSVKELSRRAKKSGAPKEIVDRFVEIASPTSLASLLARGFAWKTESLLEGAPESPPLEFAVSFKARSPEKAKSSALVRLARTLSEVSASVYADPIVALPNDPGEIREQVIAESGELSLASLTEWAWSRGVVVVPMSGPGFAAAAWYIESRPAVVLKVAPNLIAYWLFALAHEIGHLVLGHVGDEGVVDIDKPLEESDDEQEAEANRFALDLLVPDSDRLFAEIRERTAGSLERQKKRFKWEVIEVAKQAKLSPALLAIVAAHAMSDVAEPVDRWGSAINIAKEEGEARPTVRKAFEERVDLDSLSELDAALVRAVVLE